MARPVSCRGGTLAPYRRSRTATQPTSAFLGWRRVPNRRHRPQTLSVRLPASFTSLEFGERCQSNGLGNNLNHFSRSMRDHNWASFPRKVFLNTILMGKHDNAVSSVTETGLGAGSSLGRAGFRTENSDVVAVEGWQSGESTAMLDNGGRDRPN